MRVQLLSDLHFEFHKDGGRALVEDCYTPDVDVVVLAGDITTVGGIVPALEIFSALYPHVIYVHGNHEFYGSNRHSVVIQTLAACELFKNVHWLDDDVVEIDGQRFLGTPLWYPGTPAAFKNRHCMNDYTQIRGFESWVYAEHERAKLFLETEVRPGDIVVTHHLPAKASILDVYKNSPLNCYFYAPMEHVIHKKMPAFWLHGHTHGSLNYIEGETRVLCNPFGYVRYEENWRFDNHMVIDTVLDAVTFP